MPRRRLTAEVVRGDTPVDLRHLSRLLAASAVRQHLEDAERATAVVSAEVSRPEGGAPPGPPT